MQDSGNSSALAKELLHQCIDILFPDFDVKLTDCHPHPPTAPTPPPPTTPPHPHHPTTHHPPHPTPTTPLMVTNGLPSWVMLKVFTCHNVSMHFCLSYKLGLFAYIKILHETKFIVTVWVKYLNCELWCIMQHFAIYWPHRMVPWCLDWVLILHDHWGCLEETWICG